MLGTASNCRRSLDVHEFFKFSLRPTHKAFITGHKACLIRPDCKASFTDYKSAQIQQL
jgi:hypothetical protein